MTTRSLQNARFALDGNTSPWSLRDSVGDKTWPALALTSSNQISVAEFCRRFSNAGRELREIDNGAPTSWQHISRDSVVTQLRRRIRNPGIPDQGPTDLCGPYSLLMEFARRRPATYVRAAGELLSNCVFTTLSGRTFVAAADLRSRPVPDDVAAADWLFAATIRDCENVTDDIDDAQGIEGITWPYEVEEWIEDVLGLKADYHPCWISGEISALQRGQEAINAGGVAILLVDSSIVHKAPDDSEEDVWLRRREFTGGSVGDWSDRVHCEDDSLYPNHYVVLLGNLAHANSESNFSVRLWSFGFDYKISGSGEGFGEYLYAVITGVPQ